MLCLLFTTNIKANNFFPNKEQLGHVVKKKFKFEEQEVSYFIYMPKTLDSRSLQNMNIIFHGEYSNAEDFLNKTQIFNKLKNKNESMIAFNSSSNDWFSNKRKYIKDKKFIKNILNELLKLNYKKYKIYAYSSGGTFVNNLICEDNQLSKIRNIVTINASGKKEWLDNCEIPYNLNYKAVIGTEDDYYTYENKEKKSKKHKLPEEDFLTMKEFYEKLRIKLNCSNEKIKTQIEENITDETFVIKNSFICNSKNKNNFDLYIIEKMGHNYPNAIDYPLEDFRGRSNKDIKIYEMLN